MRLEVLTKTRTPTFGCGEKQFRVRDTQSGGFEEAVTANVGALDAILGPGKTHFYWLDFGQSRTLPLGPVEGGNWFYAPARQQVNLLGYYVWGCGMDKPTYVTFLSNILEHDSSYVEAAYEALFKLLPSASSVLCHEQWGDVGLHFRSYQHFAYFLDTLPQRWKTAGSLQFLEVEHGKGKIDGMMGRIRQWTNVIASKVVISTVDQYAKLLQGRADHAMIQDPDGPRYIFEHLKPPAKSQFGKKILDGPKMGIYCNSTYGSFSFVCG